MNAPSSDFVASFNAAKSPKEALRSAREAGLTPADVGRLLFDAGEEGVDVELLGACLGHQDPFWQELAQCYPENFACFAGMEVVAAIRAYLWRFKLPGEALQIDRVMSGFARAYYAHNRPADDAAAEGGERPCWDEGVSGWYVRQPSGGTSGAGELCCAHCGVLDGQHNGDLRPCGGCKLLYFCRPCRRIAHRQGHAVAGTFGYGRACVGALSAAGQIKPGGTLTCRRFGGSYSCPEEVTAASAESFEWKRVSPFKSEDAVMVLAFAIIMLTTNLHSGNVKKKMQKHEFLGQTRGVNAGSNFPGDFLADIYDEVQRQELQVVRGAAAASR